MLPLEIFQNKRAESNDHVLLNVATVFLHRWIVILKFENLLLAAFPARKQ